MHYRVAGHGPPVLLLHQTPASSAELEPLMRHLAPHFTVLAPDTPGFGHSDPLCAPDDEPDIDRYTGALHGLFDALGLERAALYGSHTGAIFATRFAHRHPHRLWALVPNGVLLNSAADRAELRSHYVQRVVPDWAGTHLAWLWSRLRDQLVFYPAYRRDAAHRIEWPMTLAEIEAAATDLLDAGDHYRTAYLAALPYELAPDLASLQLPTLLAVARSDALSAYVPAYPPPSRWLQVAVPPDGAGLFEAIAGFLREQATGQPAWAGPAAAAATELPAAGRSCMVDTAGGQWHLRGSAGPAGAAARPLLLLHDLGSSARALDAVVGGLAGTRPLLVPDLPGHGLSDGFDARTPAAIAAALAGLLQRLDVGELDVLAVGASAAVALALAQRRPLHRLLLCNPRAVADAARAERHRHLPPDLQADPAGSHLQRAWGWLKDRELYAPWCDRQAATALTGLQPPRPAQLQRALIDLLRARPVLPALLDAALDEAPWERLAAAGATVLASAGHPAHAALAALGCPVQPLPDEAHAWARPLLAALG